MKSQDTVAAADALAAVAPPGLHVVCAQNGVDNERVAARRFALVHAMCVRCSASYLEPGTIRAFGAPRMGILDVGRFPTGVDDVDRQIAADFENAVMYCEADPDVMRRKYAKLLTNTNNALEAAGGEAARKSGLRERVRNEAMAAFRAAGIAFELPADPRNELVTLELIDGTSFEGNSTWQSLARGAAGIEVDALNGEIALLGRLYGVPTPVNATLQRVAQRMMRERIPSRQHLGRCPGAGSRRLRGSGDAVKRSLRTIALALTVALGAAGSITAAPEPVRIDALLAQTGGAAFLGTEEAATLKLAAAYVNAHGDQGPAGRVCGRRRAVEPANGGLVDGPDRGAHHPSVVIGTGFTATCKAISPLVEATGPVLYCITPGVQPLAGGYVFSANISTHDLAPVTLRFFREKGWRKVALISSTDATGQDFETGFNEALSRLEFRSMELVSREHFNTTDLSVAAQMTRIKASGAQAVVLWATGTGFGTLLRGYHDAGLDIPAAGGNGNLIFPQLQQYAAFIPPQLYFAAPRAIAEGGVDAGPVRNAQTPYFAALKSAGLRSDIPTTMAWDPAMILIDALRKLGPDAPPAKIRAYIEGLHNWAGILGVYDFRDRSQRGLGESNAVILRYDGSTNAVTTVSRPSGYLR